MPPVSTTSRATRGRAVPDRSYDLCNRRRASIRFEATKGHRLREHQRFVPTRVTLSTRGRMKKRVGRSKQPGHGRGRHGGYVCVREYEVFLQAANGNSRGFGAPQRAKRTW